MSEVPAPNDEVSFSFGENWKAFNKRGVTEEQVASAVHDLEEWFGRQRIEGRSVADVGCGSGLPSLAFHLLGASRILSFDRDIGCIEATREHWGSAGRPGGWSIVQGSATDRAFLNGLGRFDIVYSWGVLQHTGVMWASIENVMSLVERGGLFLIGIYAKGPRYEKHLAMKKAYNRAGRAGKQIMIGRAIVKKMWKRLKRGQNPLAWNEKRARGMSAYHDIVDWLGGLPYEASTAEEMERFFSKHGFALEKSAIKREGGVSVYLFRSTAPMSATA